MTEPTLSGRATIRATPTVIRGKRDEDDQPKGEPKTKEPQDGEDKLPERDSAQRSS